MNSPVCVPVVRPYETANARIPQHEVERILEIWKRGADELDTRSIPCAPVPVDTWELDMIDQILGDQLVDQLGVVLVPDLLGDAPHERLRRL